jgi:hypothetical protein
MGSAGAAVQKFGNNFVFFHGNPPAVFDDDLVSGFCVIVAWKGR